MVDDGETAQQRGRGVLNEREKEERREKKKRKKGKRERRRAATRITRASDALFCAGR
jgi:hypothetical protein